MNPYGVDVREDNLIGPLARLKIIYDEIPATTGCEKCEEVNGKEDKHWCCTSNSPSMYYTEFLYVWQEVQKWGKQKRKDLILRAIRNYLSNSLHKSCIFYVDGCSCYQHRPLMCRFYGVINKDSWNRRLDVLKDRQKDKFSCRDQCSLVSICQDGYKSDSINPKDEDKWFLDIRQCEKRIGVNGVSIALHDKPGGSYRTFHDHLLIELFEPVFLEMLSKMRMSNPSPEDIDKTIIAVEGML